eukprot:scaffold194973_cov43-Prasinocladus_malaysianus.AAC.1
MGVTGLLTAKSERLAEAASEFEDFGLNETDPTSDEDASSAAYEDSDDLEDDDELRQASYVGERIEKKSGRVTDVDIGQLSRRLSMDVATVLSEVVGSGSTTPTARSSCQCHAGSALAFQVMPTDFELGVASYYAG